MESTIHFSVAQYPDINPKENPIFFHCLAMATGAELMNIRHRTKAGLAEAKKMASSWVQTQRFCHRIIKRLQFHLRIQCSPS
jgi:hypothetical protein